MFGEQVSVIALPLTAVLALHASAASLGVLFACLFAPFLGLPLLMGVLVDRGGRRRWAVAANLGRSFLLGSVPVLWILGRLTLVDLFGVALAMGVFAVMFETAYTALVPSLVPSEQLVAGNSLLMVSSSSAQTAGPGLGALLVEAITAPVALFANAASYLVSAINLAWLPVSEPPTVSSPPDRSLRRELVAGLRAVFSNRFLRAILAHAGAFNFFGQFFEVLIVLYVVVDLHLSVVTLGLVVGVSGVGAVLGPLLASPAERRFPFGRLYLVSILVEGVGSLFVPLARGSPAESALMVGTGLFFLGIGVAMSSVYALSARQTLLPAETLARGLSSYRTVTYGVIPLGALAAGFLAGTVGVPETLLIGSVGMALAPVFIAASPLVHLRTLSSAREGATKPSHKGSTSQNSAVPGPCIDFSSAADTVVLEA